MKQLRLPIALVLVGLLIVAAPASAATPVAPANGQQFKDAYSVTLKWTLEPGESGTESIEWSRKPETRPDGAFVSPAGTEGNEMLGDDNSYELDLDDGTYYWHVQSFVCPPSNEPYQCYNAATKWGPTFSFTNVVPPVRRKPLTRAQLAKRRAEKRAARAVERKVERHLDWEQGIDEDVAADCNARGRSRYRCEFNFWYGTDSRGLPDLIDGAARVKQSGKRYYVDFRIYW